MLSRLVRGFLPSAIPIRRRPSQAPARRRQASAAAAQRANTAPSAAMTEAPVGRSQSALAAIPAPLGIGKVELADGRWESGFICDSYGLEGATDISEFGGWRSWLQR